MRKWAAGFLVLAAALLFYVACGDSPTSPGSGTTTTALEPPTGPFGPGTGPFGPGTGPFGPGGGGGGTPTPTKTTTATATATATTTTTPTPTASPYQQITTVAFVASGAQYNVGVNTSGVTDPTIYIDQTQFFAQGTFDPEIVVTANADAFFNSDPLVVLNVKQKARVSVWVPGALVTNANFVVASGCPNGTPIPALSCWGNGGGAVPVLDANNANFFTQAVNYVRVFNPGPVPLGPRSVDNPPNDGTPQMYFITVVPCGFGGVVCP